MTYRKIVHFYDLDTWKEAHKLVLLVYKYSQKLPSKERFVLVSQMTRAVVSISSNIAEGFGRRNKKEKTQFYYIARASLIELQNQIFICKDMGYFSKSVAESIWKQSVLVHKMLNALISSLNR